MKSAALIDLVVSLVNSGESLDKIKRRIISAIVSNALIRNRGSQAAAARDLKMHRATMAKWAIWCRGVEPACYGMEYKEALHLISRTAVNYAIRMSGGNKTKAEGVLKCSKHTVWRFSGD